MHKPMFHLKPLTLACTILCASATNTLLAAPTLTEFTLDNGVDGVEVGTFNIGSPVIGNLANLAGTGFTFNFTSQSFTPSETGSFTFGMSSSAFDPVLILYEVNHDAADPDTNAVNLNDDSDGLGAGGVVMGTCGGNAPLCPKLTETLTANTKYIVVITTFLNGVAVTLPVDFFVFGEPIIVGEPVVVVIDDVPVVVVVNDIPVVVIAEPDPISVFGSSSALTNTPAFGAAKVIDATPELLALFTAANLTEDQAISEAVSQVLPLLTGSAQVAASNALSGINRVIQARQDSNTGLSSGDGFLGDRHIWLKPFGAWTDQDDRNGVNGFDADTYGVAFGFDGMMNSHDPLRLGAAFAYAKADVDSKNQRVEVDVYQLIGYGSYSVTPATEINFQIDIGHNENRGQRNIAFINSTARSKYDSLTGHLGFSIMHTLKLSANTRITPSIRVDYTRYEDDDYTEEGANLLNLNVKERDSEALVFSVDTKLNHKIGKSTEIGANLGVGYDTRAEVSSLTSTFAGSPNAAFATFGLDPDPWIGRAGLSVSYTTEAGTKLSINYDTEVREDFVNQTASLKARWVF